MHSYRVCGEALEIGYEPQFRPWYLSSVRVLPPQEPLVQVPEPVAGVGVAWAGAEEVEEEEGVEVQKSRRRLST